MSERTWKILEIFIVYQNVRMIFTRIYLWFRYFSFKVVSISSVFLLHTHTHSVNEMILLRQNKDCSIPNIVS